MRTNKVLVLTAVINGLLGVNSIQSAQASTEAEKDAKIEALERRLLLLEKRGSAFQTSSVPVDETIHKLDQKVRVLQRQSEIDKEAAVAAAKKAPKFDVSRKGFTLESADKDFSLRIRGLIQAHSRFFHDDAATPTVNPVDSFDIRRARILLQGKLYKNFDYFLQTEFAGASASLLDAYVGYQLIPEFSVRAGRFLVPFGIEHFNSAGNLTFVERSLADNLVPDRDNGVEFYGNIGSELLEYEVGVGNGVRDGGGDRTNSDNADDKEFFGRVFAAPFAETSIEPLRNLRFGVAGTSGDQFSNAALNQGYKTAGRQTFFSYNSDVVADGNRYRISPQLFYTWGPIGLLSEYVLSSQEVKNAANQKARLDNNAWQVAASYVLTGEELKYRSGYPAWQNGIGLKPAKDFDPFKGKWGAWQVAARYNQLNEDNGAFNGFANINSSARRASSWEVGLNWYLNSNVSATLDYAQTHFNGGAAGGSNRDTENVVQSRVQVAF